MSRSIFLLLNLALAFYNAGTIWAHEIDIFRTWQLVERESFHRIQQAHWRRLPYWVFLPVGLGLAGAVALLWFRPPTVSRRVVAAALLCQLTSLLLTGLFWGPWQAKLSRDERGSESPYLARILASHWIRTSLINASGLFLLLAAVEAMR